VEKGGASTHLLCGATGGGGFVDIKIGDVFPTTSETAGVILVRGGARCNMGDENAGVGSARRKVKSATAVDGFKPLSRKSKTPQIHLARWSKPGERCVDQTKE